MENGLLSSRYASGVEQFIQDMGGELKLSNLLLGCIESKLEDEFSPERLIGCEVETEFGVGVVFIANYCDDNNLLEEIILSVMLDCGSKQSVLFTTCFASDVGFILNDFGDTVDICDYVDTFYPLI